MSRIEDTTPIKPYVDHEDVEQEYQLLMLEYQNNPLQGTDTPSRDIIRKRLQGRMSESLVGEIPIHATALDPGAGDEMERRVEAAAQLVEWSFSQPEEAQNIIIAFLEDPTEHMLTITINRLVKKGYIEQPEEPSDDRPTASLADLLRRQIEQAGTITLQELYELARVQHVSKRPNAAVRQTVRRFERQKLVTRDLDNETVTWRGE